MSKILYIILISIILSSQLINAQLYNTRFEEISINDGLSQNTVLSICQDKKGFLWFATYDGLNRYDGKEFRIFRQIEGDSTSIVHNVIRRIFEDSRANLWIGTEGGISLFNPETEKFKNFVHDPQDPTSIPSNRQRGFVEDLNNKLWIATEGGVCFYDYDSGKFTRLVHDPNNSNSISDNFVRSVFADSKGMLWFGTANGLNMYDDSTKTFTSFFHDPKDKHSISGNIIMAIEEDSSGNIWIGTWANGVSKYNRRTHQFVNYKHNPDDPSTLKFDMIYDILNDSNNEIWISTYGNGLEKYNREKDNFIHYQFDLNDKFSFSGSTATCLFEDNSGILWIGTDFAGVNKLDKRKNQFRHVKRTNNDVYNLNNNSVHTFAENPADGGKYLWFGTTGGGLGFLDRTTGKYKFYVHDSYNPNSLSNDIVRKVLIDKFGYVWIGTDDGLNRFDPRTKKFYRYFHTPNDSSSLRGNIMKTIFEDREGQLWIGTNQFGLAKYVREKDSFINYYPDANSPNSLNDDIIWCINEDAEGRLWLGTNSGGINVFDKKKGVVKTYLADFRDSTSLSNNKVLCMLRDKKGTLWLGTAGGGLNKYNSLTDNFTSFNEKDGLVSNTVHAILEDDDENLWISTNRGLSKFDTKNGKFMNFFENDGLQSQEFHVNSALKSVTGEFFFGGINGFNFFYPKKIKQNEHVPNIVLTDLKIFNKSVLIGREVNGRVILKKSITELNELHLSHKDEVFSFEFAALDYASPSQNNYAYIMEGFEKNWNYIGNRNYASYTKLPDGEYTFRVKGSNNSGIWNETGISLNIYIQPPFWETLWFRLITIIVFSTGLFVVYKMRVRYIENKRRMLEDHNRELFQEIKERKQTEKELIKAKEVAEIAKEAAEKANELKSDFLAQISHEIRSPLNVMQSYLGLIKEELPSNDNSVISDSFLAIESANERIIRTIDLIINMSEIQLGIYQPSIIRMNLLNDVLKGIMVEYSQKAKKKGLEITIIPEIKKPVVYGDRYSITQIFVNLIDNAIKYSHHGKISILLESLENNKLAVHVRDNGIGISKEYLPHLFEEFSQEEHGYTRTFEGNGLGLALVKKYCLINNAEIEVESEKGKGTEFTVSFTKTEVEESG